MVQSEHPVASPSTPTATPVRDRLSTAAFVLGLVSALTGVLYFVAVPFGVAGVVVSLLALRHRGGVRRVALGGLLLSIVGLIVGLGVIAFLLLDDDDANPPPSVVNGIESGSTDVENPPQHDLDGAVTCTVDGGALRANGSITNNTAAVADYRLIATWERDGREIAQATSLVDDLAPSATQAWEVAAVGDDLPGVVTCRVVRIDRD